MLHPDQPAARTRVIINTDAKNEADDQYAIVHAALTPSFDLRGMIAAHYGKIKHPQTMQQSRLEIDKLYQLMDIEYDYPIVNGAADPIPDELTPQPSAGAQLIIDEAMRDDTDQPLFAAFFGPLTDMATALLLEPRIVERDLTCVWIGGGPYPQGGHEYNLSNDIAAANLVFDSDLTLWQIPQDSYRLMAVGYAELMIKVAPYGDLGKYLVDQLVQHNSRTRPEMEYRSLGDSPAVGVIMNPSAGRWHDAPAPRFHADQSYVHTPGRRPIRVYDTIDARFVLEDMFAKLQLWVQGRGALS